MDCKNCNKEINSKFCPECGQPTSLKRIDRHYIVHEIEHVLHFERGILYTIRELTINPGQNIRKYLSENRSRLVKPIIFIIITSLIYTILNNFFHIEDGYVKYHEAKGETASAVGTIVKWVQGHYGYANIMMGIFIALWLKLFFRKYDYNFYEIVIMLCFVMGMGMLIFSIFVILQGLTHSNLNTFAAVLGVLYSAWAIGHFFEKRKMTSYLKAFIAYVLGMITFWVFPVSHRNINRFIKQTLIMKNKIGFNLVFAILSFPIGLALFREFDFQTFTFENTALSILYLVTFIFCIFFMLKKKKDQPEK